MSDISTCSMERCLSMAKNLSHIPQIQGLNHTTRSCRTFLSILKLSKITSVIQTSLLFVNPHFQGDPIAAVALVVQHVVV